MIYNKISSETCSEIVSIFEDIIRSVNDTTADIPYILYNYSKVLGSIASKVVDRNVEVCLDTNVTFTALTVIHANTIHVDVVNLIKISEANPQELTGMFLHELAHIILDKQISIRYDYLHAAIRTLIADAEIKGHSGRQLDAVIYNSLFTTSGIASSEYSAVEMLHIIRNNLYKVPFIQIPANHTVESYCYSLVNEMYPELGAIAKELHDRTTLDRGGFLIYSNIANYISRVDTILSLIDDYSKLENTAIVECEVTSIIKASYISKYILSYDDKALEPNTSLAKAIDDAGCSLYGNLLDIRDSALPSAVTKELLAANKLLDSMLPKGNIASIEAYETYKLFTSITNLEDDNTIANAINKYTQSITKG